MSGNRQMPSLPSADEQPAKEPAEQEIAPQVSSRKSLEVEALRPGFFEGVRRSVGDKFVIPNMEKLGSWMKLSDPVLEKKRRDAEKAKKKVNADLQFLSSAKQAREKAGM